MKYDYIRGRVDKTGVEITDNLDDPDDPCVLVELHKIDDADPVLDRAGATQLRNVLHQALTRGRVVESITRCDAPIRARIDRGDYVRTSGDVICTGRGRPAEPCGFAYREHPEVRGFPTLHILCDGRLVKL